jgi:hypothetical protein
MKSIIAFFFVSTVLAVLAASLLARPGHAATSDTNMEILKDKVKADKKLVVAANMGLTDEEAKGFWPLYDAYQTDLEQINQRLNTTIKAYADAYNANSLNDDQAKQLLAEAIASDEAEVKLRQSYAEKLAKVLPGKKVARYLQIETKIRAIVRYELAAVVPLVP